MEVKKYRSREELKEYFGRNLIQVITSLRDGVLTQKEKTVYVQDLLDFKIRSRPCKGCDMVIDNYSTNSDYIYDLNKGLFMDLGHFSLHRYKHKNLSTYCETNQVDKIKELHIISISNAVNSLVIELKKEIKELIDIKLTT